MRLVDAYARSLQILLLFFHELSCWRMQQNRLMALCHADAMQIILFCMAVLPVGDLYK